MTARRAGCWTSSQASSAPGKRRSPKRQTSTPPSTAAPGVVDVSGHAWPIEAEELTVLDPPPLWRRLAWPVLRVLMPSLKHKMARLVMRRYPFHCGQGRLIDRSGLRRLAFDEQTLKVRCSDGFEMTIIPNDHIGRHLYLTGDFDRTILDVLASFCTGGERILDIGANIGYIACGLLFRVPDCLV